LSKSASASVLVAIGGRERLPQFHLALAALRAQSYQALEVIVIEQGPYPSLQSALPADVRYKHDFVVDGTPFNKSRALNLAAALAQGEFFLIHDGDFVVPTDYVAEVVRSLGRASGVRPARFIFYLDHSSTDSAIQSRAIPPHGSIEYVTQNTPCPMGLRRSTYSEIGGHDESFLGWGGEDTEFLSRLRTHSVAEGGWLPVIHLWHPSAPKKINGDRNRAEQNALLSLPPQERIERLTAASHSRTNLNSGDST